jgi:hypothetical protein
VPALTGAARRQVEGLVGSERLEDARALLAAVRRGEPEDGEPLGQGRMRWALERLEREGSTLMQGARPGRCGCCSARRRRRRSGSGPGSGWTRRLRLSPSRPDEDREDDATIRHPERISVNM